MQPFNDSNRNKKRCSSCLEWRDGLAPLSAKGGTLGAAASDIGLVNDDTSCHDENSVPNNESPPRAGSLMKSGIKRISPSRRRRRRRRSKAWYQQISSVIWKRNYTRLRLAEIVCIIGRYDGEQPQPIDADAIRGERRIQLVQHHAVGGIRVYVRGFIHSKFRRIDCWILWSKDSFRRRLNR